MYQLYRCYSADATLLFIGKSLHALARIASSGTAWFAGVDRVEVENFPSKRAAAYAEELAIRNEKPLHNAASPSVRELVLPDDALADDDEPPNQSKRFYTRAQLAGELGVTPATLVVWEKVGLPVLRIGRKIRLYELDEVVNWMRRNSPRAA